MRLLPTALPRVAASLFALPSTLVPAVTRITLSRVVSRCADVLGGVLRVGQVIEAFDEHPTQRKWCEASVVDERATEVKVHFKVSSVASIIARHCGLCC